MGSRESAPTNNREQAQTSERFFSFSRRARSPARARPRRRTLALALALALALRLRLILQQPFYEHSVLTRLI